MKQSTELGVNRTGIDMSPVRSKEMIGDTSRPIVHKENGSLMKIRSAYIKDADLIGTVPVPGTLKGITKLGVKKLKGEKPEILIDKLGERLAFERTGVRLYESFIMKCQVRADEAELVPSLEVLQQISREEVRHFEMVRSAIEFLGADPTAQTPSADTNGVAVQGLMQVLTDPRTTVMQCLQSILVAELTDNEGWSALIQLVDQMGFKQWVKEFHSALEDEQWHLEQVRAWHSQLVMIKAKAA